MHGGDIYRNNIKLDFSVNVNPMGVPTRVKFAMEQALRMVECYPDPVCEKLRMTLSDYYQVEATRILCGNGASELLLAVSLFAKEKYSKGGNEKVLLLAPCFSGYEKALGKAGFSNFVFYDLSPEQDFAVGDDWLERMEMEQPAVVMLANPSNPTGRLMEREQIVKALEICERMGTLLLVDECFLELTGKTDISMVEVLAKKQISCENLLILKAFTKDFAIPGVRMGYLLCGSKQVAEKVNRYLPEWNISGIAQAAGAAAVRVMEETDYLSESAELIMSQRSFLEQELKAMGLKVFAYDANFLLIRSDGINWYEELLKQQILIRDCSDYHTLGPGWYRIAVRTREENEVLINTMKGIQSTWQK